MNFKRILNSLRWRFRCFINDKKTITAGELKKQFQIERYRNSERFSTIESQINMISQNQFEQSGLKKHQELQDKISNVLTEWDRTIAGIKKRLEQLEKINQ